MTSGPVRTSHQKVDVVALGGVEEDASRIAVENPGLVLDSRFSGDGAFVVEVSACLRADVHSVEVVPLLATASTPKPRRGQRRSPWPRPPPTRTLPGRSPNRRYQPSSVSSRESPSSTCGGIVRVHSNSDAVLVYAMARRAHAPGPRGERLASPESARPLRRCRPQRVAEEPVKRDARPELPYAMKGSRRSSDRSRGPGGLAVSGPRQSTSVTPTDSHVRAESRMMYAGRSVKPE